jgi:hypothetical protein
VSTRPSGELGYIGGVQVRYFHRRELPASEHVAPADDLGRVDGTAASPTSVGLARRARSKAVSCSFVTVSRATAHFDEDSSNLQLIDAQPQRRTGEAVAVQRGHDDVVIVSQRFG